jgi:hypothetical protein
MSEELAATEWTILKADPLTGELIDAAELAYRHRIRAEAEQGKVGVDSFYLEAQRIIHQPLTDERGLVSGDGWTLERANRTTLRVAFEEGPDRAAVEKMAVAIARLVIDDFAAEVMIQLFTIANDPPNWRRPRVTVRLSNLLNRLGFKPDSRGVHYSEHRRKLSTTLLALSMTHVGVQRSRHGGRKGAEGFISPLIGPISYATDHEVGQLSPFEIFERGLPDIVSVTIAAPWYQGLRDESGAPGTRYSLIPRPRAEGGRKRGGSRSPVVRVLREYLQRYHQASGERELAITRSKLLEIAGITNRVTGQANTTLSRALDALIAEGLLTAYTPSPLPLDPMDLIVLSGLTV